MIPFTFSRFHPARLLAPVCRRSFFEGLIGTDRPTLYRALSGSFPFRHACNTLLAPQGLRIGSSVLRITLQLGIPCHVEGDGTYRVAVYSRGKSGAQLICHFRAGRLVLLQQVISDYRAASAAVAGLEERCGLRLPAQEEDFLLFNGAGERIVVRRDGALQLFYLDNNHALLAPEVAPAPRYFAPVPQLTWGLDQAFGVAYPV